MRLQATPHTRAAELALNIYARVLQSVEAGALVRQAVQAVGDSLFIQGSRIDLSAFDRVFVFGAGKAAVEMGSALAELLGHRLSGGLLITKPPAKPAGSSVIPVMFGAHPVPDDTSITAGERMLEEARELNERDLVLFVLSGGASALMDAPAQQISLEDLRETNRVLLESGLDIRAMNRVRSSISRTKAGGLARAFAPASTVCLVLSDVVGNDLRTIGSGPLFGDRGSLARRKDSPIPGSVLTRLPEAVRDRVAHWMPQPTPHVEHFVIGSVSLAVQEAVKICGDLGLMPLPYADPLGGEAKQMARAICLEAERQLENRSRPFCLVFGGETTVTLKDDTGLGGRCQEMAVASAMRLSRLSGCCLLAAGTDGNDGPTDAAGGFVDHLTCDLAVEFGVGARAALRSHKSYEFLRTVGGLIKTGPTGSNVNDLVLFVAT
jgi:glycerate 2-kinase